MNIYRLDAMNKLADINKIDPLDPKWIDIDVEDSMLNIKRRDAWSKVSPLLTW